jgi:chromosome segregation ATPase
MTETMQNMQKEINSIHVEKDKTEHELLSINLQKELLNKDFQKLSSDHLTLKNSYQSQVFQSAENEKRNKISSDMILEETVRKYELMNENIIKRNIELEKLPEVIIELKQKNSSNNTEIARLNNEVKNIQEELLTYMKLTDNLKTKLKDLSGANKDEVETGRRDFLDTFEEVMKEEMQAMKGAFEGRHI